MCLSKSTRFWDLPPLSIFRMVMFHLLGFNIKLVLSLSLAPCATSQPRIDLVAFM